MTVDRDVTRDGSAELSDPAMPRREAAPGSAPVTRATVVAYAVTAVGLVGWFLFGWLVLRQGFVASVGEAVGTAFALLLAVSIVGTVRRSRRD